MRTLKYEYSPFLTSSLIVLLAASYNISLISSAFYFFFVISKFSMIFSIITYVVPVNCLTSCFDVYFCSFWLFFIFDYFNLSYFLIYSSFVIPSGTASPLICMFESMNMSSFSLEYIFLTGSRSLNSTFNALCTLFAPAYSRAILSGCTNKPWFLIIVYIMPNSSSLASSIGVL